MHEGDFSEFADWLARRISLAGPSPEITRYVQRTAVAEGYDVGPIDGCWGPRTDTAWRQMAGLLPTPLPSAYEAKTPRDGGSWPAADDASLQAFYGAPGENMVQFTLPFPMRLAWDTGTIVKRASANRACVEAFQAALEGIKTYYGDLAAVRAHRMDRFGGIFNLRRKRGGTAWSVHAYGAAIDLDPEQNQMGWPWPGRATMPKEIVDLFEGLGANAGARWSSADAMHFQWTK